MIKKEAPKIILRFGALTVVTLLLAALVVSAVQAAPPAQDPRPPAPRAGDGDKNGGSRDDDDDDGGDSDREPAPITCGALSGRVNNWGHPAGPGIPVVLYTGSWETRTPTTSAGDYMFAGLGVGMARLDLILAPHDPAQPVAPEAVVYLNCDFPMIANLGLAGDDPLEGAPLDLEMTAAPAPLVTWSNRTVITLTLKNELPHAISNVVVTNLIPPGLEALNVTTSADTPQENIRLVDGGADGRAAVVYLETVAAGVEETVTLAVTAIEDTPLAGRSIQNTATVFYQEGVALQASIDLMVAGQESEAIPAAVETNSSPPPVKAAVDEERPTGDTAPVVQVQASPTLTPHPSPAATLAASAAVPSDETGPPDANVKPEQRTEEADGEDLLPLTGDNGADDESLAEGAPAKLASKTNFIGSMSGIGLILLAFTAYALKSRLWPTV